MQSLQGKTVLVTGAAGTVGRACVEVFLQAGARLALTDRLSPAPEILAHPEILFQPAEIADAGAVDSVVAAALGRFGEIDAVVLAAGVEGPAAAVEDIREDDIDRVWAVNVKGSLFAMQACLRHMKARGAGSIVALSSISGVVGAAQLAAYAISKHAVIGLVRSAALEAGRHGVRVNAVCPGPIESDMMRRLDKALSEIDPRRAQGGPDAALSLPLQRYVTAEEVARMAAFLCSDDSASCHGATFMVDGGFTAK